MRYLALTVAALVLTGCATQQDPALLAAANRPVTCSDQLDCQFKWSRALKWVLDNSAYKIQTQSDMLISTMGPLPNDPRPAYTVSRLVLPNGQQEFDFRGGCDNIFGCLPSLLQAKASFANAVMGPAT